MVVSLGRHDCIKSLAIGDGPSSLPRDGVGLKFQVSNQGLVFLVSGPPF